MEPYDFFNPIFFNPIFYTEKQADEIAIAMHGVVVDGKSVESLVSNKKSFLQNLRKAALEDRDQYFLSFKRVANGKISLHLNRSSAYINLGIFDVDPDLVNAIHLNDKEAFAHFAFEEVGNRLYAALEKVAKREHKYDAKVADAYIMQRFDLKNFPEVEILSNVRLDQDTYKYMRKAHRELITILYDEQERLRSAYMSAAMQFEHCYDFQLSLNELYMDHLDSGEQQTAYFEPIYYKDDDGESYVVLRKTELLVADKDISPKTASSLFCIKTDEEIALDYEDALRNGTLSKMRTRFDDMLVAISMALVQNFPKNCVLVDDVVKTPLNSMRRFRPIDLIGYPVC